jgi:hypothetical protein
MSRYRAASVHFGISFLIFLALAYLVVFVWYPGFFFDTDGGWQGMRIIAAVDLVLGPLLTLIVYKAGKPSLKFDLSAIATLQLVCLAAGVWIVSSERPIAMVYVDGWFFAMNAGAYREVGVAPPDLSGVPGPSPKWVMVDIPDDPFEQSAIRSAMYRSHKPLRTLTERYAPFSPSALAPDDAVAGTLLTERLPSAVSVWLTEHGGALSDYRFYRYGARYKEALVAFHVPDNAFVGMLALPAPG